MARPIGRVVAVYGTRLIKVSVDSLQLGEVSRPGTYIKVPVGGVEVYGMVLGFNLVDEAYERIGRPSPIGGYEGLDLARNELNACLMGYRDERGVHRGVPILPRPGSEVYPLSDDEYKAIWSLGDVEVGRLLVNPSIPCKLDLNGLLTRHFAVLAMTGAGKSNLVAVLIARILEHYPRSRVLIIDAHSEYVELHRIASSMGLSSVIYCPRGYRLVEGAEDLEVPYWLLSLEELYSVIGLDSRATKQRLLFRSALKELRGEDLVDEPIYFDLGQLKTRLQSFKGRDASLDDLLLKLEDFRSNKDLEFIASPRRSLEEFNKVRAEAPSLVEASQRFAERFVEELLGRNLSIITLGGLPFEAQDVVVSATLRLLWRLMVKEKIERGSYRPTLIVLEEAHAYASRFRSTASREIISRIAREGRKFGVSLGVISQRPREVDESTLSQCGTLMALRTVNPSDQSYILETMEDVMKELVDSLASLETGEALIVGPALTFPSLVKAYDFSELYGVKLGGKDVDFERYWSEERRGVG